MNRQPDADDRYERLAAAVAENDYTFDPAGAEVRADYQVGRPRRDQSSSATTPLAVRLTDADCTRLAEYARRTGQPMNSVIRAAVTDWLDRQSA